MVKTVHFSHLDMKISLQNHLTFAKIKTKHVRLGLKEVNTHLTPFTVFICPMQYPVQHLVILFLFAGQVSVNLKCNSFSN